MTIVENLYKIKSGEKRGKKKKTLRGVAEKVWGWVAYDGGDG